MNLRETIKKVLNEQVEYLGERTKLEKSVIRFINAYLKGKELPENFYGVVADTFSGKYGEGCTITFLMKRPFKVQDSDDLQEMGTEVRGLIKKFFTDEFKYGINISTTTVEHYKELKNRFFNKQNGEFTEAEITEKCWPGYTQKGMKTMFGKRYPNCVKKTKKKALREETNTGEFDYKPEKSNIHGIGIFASDDINEKQKSVFLKIHNNGFLYTNLGRYINHSKKPNVRLVDLGDKVMVIPLFKIKKGEEIVCDYDKNPYFLEKSNGVNQREPFSGCQVKNIDNGNFKFFVKC